MNIKLRLTIFVFLEFFVWGAWLLSAGAYLGSSLHFNGAQIGSVYATLGLSSIFMPTLLGIVADKWINAEKLFALCHFILVGLFILLAKNQDFNSVYLIFLLISMFYMPTLALNNSIAYYNLEKEKLDIVKAYPPIRVWGTVGFIVAAWVVDQFDWEINVNQFYLAAAASALLGIYALTMPKVPIIKSEAKKFSERFGLDALVLFKNKNMAIFFIFSMLLGASLQITNIWGVPFLNDFQNLDIYKNTFAVKHSVFLMTISQISETVFILCIPFFLKRFGIKKIMIISMFAWFLRFGLFGIGNPIGIGLVFLILSMIIYGMAFDFFIISGSIFVNKNVNSKIRSSAQGLFMMMANGFGAMIGAIGSGYIVDRNTQDGIKDWPTIWLVCAVYAIIIAILFVFLFKYKHEKNDFSDEQLAGH